MALMLLWRILSTMGQIFNKGPPQASQPNVIFILADDVGWNDVGWHNPDVFTPNLNHLARTGVRLNNSYVLPTCSPSRGALLSGYYPHRVGFQYGAKKEKPNYFPLKYKLLPQKLKELGYVTHMVGKWHIGFCKWEATPTYRGFDSYYGFYNGGSDHYTHRFGQGLDLRDNEDIVRDQDDNYSTDIFRDRALDIIRKHNRSQPMFMYLPFQAPHSPLQVPKEYLYQYRHIKEFNRRLYLAMVSAVDEAVGRIVQTLLLRKMLENTVIIFSTDNGGPAYAGANNWPLRGAKTTLWEGGTRGPAFIWTPKLKKKGYVNKKLFHTVDWYPTIVSIAGGEPDVNMDGLNQWWTLSENKRSKRYEVVQFMDYYLDRYAIRYGDYKLIEGNPGNYNGWYPPPTAWWMIPWVNKAPIRKNKRLRLYNLRVDPTESNDLSRKKPYLLRKLRKRLKEHKRRMKRVRQIPKSKKAHPKYFGGVWSPGWC